MQAYPAGAYARSYRGDNTEANAVAVARHVAIGIGIGRRVVGGSVRLSGGIPLSQRIAGEDLKTNIDLQRRLA